MKPLFLTLVNCDLLNSATFSLLRPWLPVSALPQTVVVVVVETMVNYLAMRLSSRVLCVSCGSLSVVTLYLCAPKYIIV
jgi:hypothetical protein